MSVVTNNKTPFFECNQIKESDKILKLETSAIHKLLQLVVESEIYSATRPSRIYIILEKCQHRNLWQLYFERGLNRREIINSCSLFLFDHSYLSDYWRIASCLVQMDTEREETFHFLKISGQFYNQSSLKNSIFSIGESGTTVLKNLMDREIFKDDLRAHLGVKTDLVFFD